MSAQTEQLHAAIADLRAAIKEIGWYETQGIDRRIATLLDGLVGGLESMEAQIEELAPTLFRGDLGEIKTLEADNVRSLARKGKRR